MPMICMLVITACKTSLKSLMNDIVQISTMEAAQGSIPCLMTKSLRGG
jgi:hypothetical protein